MLRKWFLILGALVGFAQLAHAQRRDMQALPAESPAGADNPAPEGGSSSGARWRVPGGRTASSANNDAAAPIDNQPSGLSQPSSAPHQPISRATKLSNTLPNEAGQELWEYDISPYTARVTSTNRPEQAVRDWILRQTGYEAWHGEPVAFLNTNRRTLLCYHTPEMQAVVQEMVDRFVNTEAESQAFGMRVITIASPNWREKAHRSLRPVGVQSPGVQAWLLHKEDASLVLADLARRSDFQEHSTPHLLVNNGQSTIVTKLRPRNYIKDVLLRSNAWPGFEPQTAQIDEGFKLEFHPLLSLDGKVIDAIIKCEIDLVEKMVPVTIDVSNAVARQQQRIEVPQAIAARLHERFRWPADQVLLISLGVVPTPVASGPGALGVKVPLLSSSQRADLLVFVDSKGKVSNQTAVQPLGRGAATYQNRYKPVLSLEPVPSSARPGEP